jgi:DNA-binding CsgD family transcriptional regulator
MARPQLQLDEQKIIDLAGFGCTNEEIAAALNVSADTIEQRFSGAIKKGKLNFHTSLRRLQARSAMGYWTEDAETGRRKYIEPSVTMQIWLGKQYLGQVDKIENDVNVDGSNIQINVLAIDGNNVRPTSVDRMLNDVAKQ